MTSLKRTYKKDIERIAHLKIEDLAENPGEPYPIVEWVDPTHPRHRREHPYKFILRSDGSVWRVDGVNEHFDFKLQGKTVREFAREILSNGNYTDVVQHVRNMEK